MHETWTDCFVDALIVVALTLAVAMLMIAGVQARAERARLAACATSTDCAPVPPASPCPPGCYPSELPYPAPKCVCPGRHLR